MMRVRAAGKSKDTEQLKSVEKALHILEAFSMDRPELSVTELIEILQIPKVSVYRFLRVLTRHGFVRQNPQTRNYRLGIRVFELGSVVLRNFELRQVAFPLIADLSRRSGETVHLGILDNDMAVSIEGVESDQSLRISLPVGKRVHLHCTGIGKAILAFLPEEERKEILASAGLLGHTRNSITEPGALAREMARIRECGYAVDNEENELGVRCVAAPIFGPAGRVMASLSISGPSSRVLPSEVQRLAGMVIEATWTISAAVGYRRP